MVALIKVTSRGEGEQRDSRPGLAKSWSVAETYKLNTNRV